MCAVFNELPDRFRVCSLKFFGGYTAAVRPVPFPNTAVKRCRADGSGLIDSARVGRRQSFLKKPEKISSPAFCFSARDRFPHFWSDRDPLRRYVETNSE